MSTPVWWWGGVTQGLHHLSEAREGLLQQCGSLPDPVPDGTVPLLGLSGLPVELLPLAGVEL